MAHIFISYSRHERDVASMLAERLTEAGYDVWWDAALLGGTRFEDEIRNVLREAKVAIILWSKSAAASDWVRAEAEVARHLKSALPVRIDDVDITSLPILFQQIHAIDLRNWDGSTSHDGYQQIMKSVIGRVGQSSGPKLSEPQAQAKVTQTSDEQIAWAELTKSPNVSADDYRAFIKRFGSSGTFGTVAQMRLDSIERRSGRTRRNIILMVLGILILGGVAAAFGLPQIRTMITSPFEPKPPAVAACAAEDTIRSKVIPVSVCLDHRVWIANEPGTDAGSVIYHTVDNQYSLLFYTSTLDIPGPTAVQQIMVNTDNSAKTPGKTTKVSDTMRTINGRDWYIWQLKLEDPAVTTTFYQIYYYSKPGQGEVELNFWTSAGLEGMPPYGDPIVQTVKFE